MARFPMGILRLWMLVYVSFLQEARLEEEVIFEEIPGGTPTKVYHFPWLTTIHRVTSINKEFFGSGSIISKRWVLGSLDSFVRKSKHTKRPYYQELNRLEVYAGQIWADPYDDEDVEFVQIRSVKQIYFLSYPNIDTATVLKFDPREEPQDLRSLRKSPFGFSMSIALIKVDVDWQWKKNILPIKLFSTTFDVLDQRVVKMINQLERKPHRFTCHVAGWRLGDHRMVQYSVIYVPFLECSSIFCAYDPRACLQWPVEGVHGCFKTLVYTDLCWTDQGSALYCEAFDKSILAVLTSAPTCGYAGLPGVYTWITAVMNLYERGTRDHMHPFRDWHKYLAPPKERLVPANE